MSQLNVNTIKNRVGNSGPTVDGNTVVSGIVTATAFVGDGSGLTGLTISGDGNLANLSVSGVSTFTGDAEFNSDVTINGTLTYQDVTNIDAVGMITARKGIQVLDDGFTVVGVSTFNSSSIYVDNAKATFGSAADLEIYHTSTASYIVDVGTGNFIIGSDGGALKITKGVDTENMAVFTPDGAAELYYDNAKKLETTTDGVTVTGGVQLGTGTTISSPASNEFIVSTNGSERVRVDSSGNLGINKTSPSVPLHVEKTDSTAARIGGSSYYLDLGQYAVGSSPAITYNGSGASLVFRDSSTERMRINSNGVIIAKNGTVAEIDTLTDASTVTPDFAASTNFTLTFTSAVGNSRTIANPSNLTAGQSGSIFLIQDGTGSRTVSWGSYWDWAGGSAPTLTTTGSAVDRIDYIVRTSTSIHAVATLAYS